MNYEDLIEEKIFESLGYLYGIDDYDVLYRYLRLRNRCINRFKKNDDEIELLMKLILDELQIQELKYKDEQIYLYPNNKNSLRNILDNFEYRANMRGVRDINNGCIIDFKKYLNDTMKDIEKIAKKNSLNYISSKYYNQCLKGNKLFELNNLFGIKEIKNIPVLEDFIQGDTLIYVSEELKCMRYLHASKFDTDNIQVINEEAFESYIYKNLNLIEDGLKPISRQYEISEGRLDILAKDINGNYVIIELKIANDKHLIWQVLYYPIAVKEKLGVENIRVITICPEYPNYLKEPLNKIDYVEMYSYKINIINSKIENIKLNRI